MMRLSLMRDVMRDLQGKGAVVRAVVDRWEHDPDSVRFLRASANFVFTFTAKGAPRVLRFNHASERHAAVVQAEVELLRRLGSRGVLVAPPVASRLGNDVEVVPTELGEFSATVFDFIGGTQPETEELNEGMFARWGNALATLHDATASCRAAGRPSWRDHLAFVDETLPAQATPALRLLRRVRRSLEALPINDDTFGLIHFDFELDNLVWQGERVWALDFDDCAHYWLAADVAFALRDLFGDRPAGVTLDDDRVRAFVGGYRDVRNLSDADLAAVPLFLAAHNLLTYARLKRALGGDPPPDEPDWLGGLRRRLASKVEAYEAGFADASL